ncbi:MAG: hypothetical protein IT457_12710 [Planctomycetes bacterium]|nr:hypothetical protein [Planctomycetota bacterium]
MSRLQLEGRRAPARAPYVATGLALAALAVLQSCFGDHDSYRVHGTVSGLGSGSLVLQLNGAEQLSVDGDGEFVFATVLHRDDPYAVTLVARPDRTAATIERAAGEVADLGGGVAVVLEPGYAIGGSVSGLGGDTVRVALNGQVEMDVASDGSFAFPDWYPAGTPYSVSVVSPPAGRTVQLDGANGSVGTADVDGVRVRARQWHHADDPSDRLNVLSHDAYGVAVAASGDGDCVVAFQQHNGVSWGIYVAERRGGVWSIPDEATDKLDVGTDPTQQPVVAAAANGDVVVCWVQSVSGRGQTLYGAERRNGQWHRPASINEALSPVGGNVDAVDVKMVADGRTLVVWTQFDGVQRRLYSAEYVAGTWSVPASIQDAFSPAFADVSEFEFELGADGDSCVLWTRGVNSVAVGSTRLLLLSERRNGTWTHPAIDTPSLALTTEMEEIDLAMNDAGDVFASWSEFDGQRSRRLVSRGIGGTWQHPGSFADAVSPADSDSWGGQIVAHEDGSCTALYYLSDGRTRVAYAECSAEGVWTIPTSTGPFLSLGDRDVGDLVACSGPGGHLVVAWADEGRPNQLFVSERVRGAWVLPSGAIDARNAGATSVAGQRLAVDDRGNVFLATQEAPVVLDGFSADIFVAEYR